MSRKLRRRAGEEPTNRENRGGLPVLFWSWYETCNTSYGLSGAGGVGAAWVLIEVEAVLGQNLRRPPGGPWCSGRHHVDTRANLVRPREWLARLEKRVAANMNQKRPNFRLCKRP